MAKNGFDARGVLPQSPFLIGMTTAFDLYGLRGLKAQKQIHERWKQAIAEPVSSAEEVILESIAAVNIEFAKLIAEHVE